MNTFIALLRGINVGGHKRVAMAALRDMCAGLGLVEAQTLLQSGNVVFRSRDENAERLERRLEQEAARRLKVDPDFLVRTADEWSDIISKNPFRREAAVDPGHLLVVVLKTAVSEAAVETLQGAIKGRERVRAGKRHLYAFYPDGVGRSKLTHVSIEKALGTRGTGRNWNTVVKLATLAKSCGRAPGALPG